MAWRELLVDEPLRLEDLDAIAARPDDAFGPEVVEDPDDNLADRPNGVGESLLADPGDKPIALPLFRGEIEQMSRDALPDSRKGAARNLRDKVDDPLAEFVDHRPRHAKVAFGQPDHDTCLEADEMRVHQCLDRRRQRVVGREQRNDA